MRYRIQENGTAPLESVTVSAARFSPVVDVGGIGGDSIGFIMALSSPSSPVGTSIQLQGSIDGTTYVAVGSTVPVAAAGTYTVGTDRPLFRYYRVAYALTTGSYNAVLMCLVKGDIQ